MLTTVNVLAKNAQVDVLLVIGHEKLYIEMQRLQKSLDPNVSQKLKILKVPKSGGVSD